VGFRETLDSQYTKGITLRAASLYSSIQTVSLTATNKMAHHHISQDMLRELFVKYFVENGLVDVIEFCGDLGTLI
jgi:hypothetical protein